MAFVSDTRSTPRLAAVLIYSAVQAALVALVWFWLVDPKPWNVQQQFYGHLGPAAFLVALGAVGFFERGGPFALVRKEAWLAVIAGGAYILADTFIMHPPLGIFDGAGQAEEEHVAIMGLVVALGVSALVLLRQGALERVPSVHFVIGAAVASLVFLGHHQHTVAGTVGHNATIGLLAIAALFRILGNLLEYSVTLIVTGFVFYSSQMGFARFVDMGGTSPGAWVAVWAMAGFASATGYMLLVGRVGGAES